MSGEVFHLSALVVDFASAIRAVDASRPVAVNARTGVPYQPGIGPHTESRTVELVVEHLRANPKYSGIVLDVPYPGASRLKCDLCVGKDPDWSWAIEVKLLRMMGDNGKPNDNMITHILSPYATHRSAVTDCEKLVNSSMCGEKAVLIYGYDYDEYPMNMAIEAFEVLCRSRVQLGGRIEAAFDGLIHPVHTRGRVYGWRVGPS